MNYSIPAIFSEGIVDITIDVVSFLLATVSNSCLLGLELRNWLVKKRISQPRFLIIVLAFIDLLSSLLSTFPRLLIFNEANCTHTLYFSIYMMTRFFVTCSLNLSKLTVVLMAIERFISVQAPFFYVRTCTVSAFCLVECILVIFTLIKAAINIYGDILLFDDFILILPWIKTKTCGNLMLVFEYDKHWRDSTVTATVDYVEMFQIAEDFILITVILVCNSGVIIGLKAMEKRVRESCPRHRDETTNDTDLMTITGKEFSRLMLAIIVVVILLTTPNMIRTLFNQLRLWRSFYADYICHHLALCSAFVNPFLYGLLRRKIRRQFAFHIRRTFSCIRGNVVTPTDLTGSESNMDGQLNLRRLAARAERAQQTTVVNLQRNECFKLP